MNEVTDVTSLAHAGVRGALQPLDRIIIDRTVFRIVRADPKWDVIVIRKLKWRTLWHRIKTWQS